MLRTSSIGRLFEIEGGKIGRTIVPTRYTEIIYIPPERIKQYVL